MIKLCSKIILTNITKQVDSSLFFMYFLNLLDSAGKPFKGERSLICLPDRSTHHLQRKNNVSEILNWSLRPLSPVSNMTPWNPMEQVMLKVCNDPE